MHDLIPNQSKEIRFVMLDAAGIEVLGLGAAFNVFISKSGQIGFAAGLGVKYEIGNGWYAYILTATETNIDGIMSMYITGAGCVQQNLWFDIDDPSERVWQYAYRTLTFSLASLQTALGQMDILIDRGDTLSLSITYLGDISGRAKIWFTVKQDLDDTDPLSIIQIEETAGLLYINKTAGTPANGSLVVNDPAAGNITITLAAVETAKLPITARYLYDIQMSTAVGVITTLRRGRVILIGDVTRAIL